jgi:hypothetical protein
MGGVFLTVVLHGYSFVTGVSEDHAAAIVRVIEG